MAYINAETTKKIREALKVKFPECKFSVSKSNNMSLNVHLMSSPYFETEVYTQVNVYWINENYSGEQLEFLKELLDTIKTIGNHYDNTDIQSDYFDCAFYMHVEIGKWDKKHQNIS